MSALLLNLLRRFCYCIGMGVIFLSFIMNASCGSKNITKDLPANLKPFVSDATYIPEDISDFNGHGNASLNLTLTNGVKLAINEKSLSDPSTFDNIYTLDMKAFLNLFSRPDVKPTLGDLNNLMIFSESNLTAVLNAIAPPPTSCNP